MKKIIGQKIGMMQTFLDNGQRVPITVIQAFPNRVLETKTKALNGYNATKVGVFLTDPKKLNKPLKRYFEKLNLGYFKTIKELKDLVGFNVGDEIKIDQFNPGEYVDVQAHTKGHGFSGAIKRWNFKVGPLGHGAGFPHRYQGSISFGRGGSQGQRVTKGKKMAGRYGHELVTIPNLTVIDVDLQNNLILIKGSVPGSKNAVVLIKSAVHKKPGVVAKPFKLSDPIALQKAAMIKEQEAKAAAEKAKAELQAKLAAEKKAKLEKKQQKQKEKKQQKQSEPQKDKGEQ